MKISNNYINAVEKRSSLEITGRTEGIEAGQTVTVNFNNVDYKTIVKEDGTFAVTVPLVEVNKLVEGETYVAKASVADAANNATIEDVEDVTVDTTSGTILVDPISEDGLLNAKEAEEPLVITGTTSGIEPGQIVTVNLNGKDYLTTVKPDGSYEVTVPLEDVKALEDGEDVPSRSKCNR